MKLCGLKKPDYHFSDPISICYFAVFCQSNIAMGQEFAELAAHQGFAGKGFAAYQTYKSGDINGSPVFFYRLDGWRNGYHQKEVLMTVYNSFMTRFDRNFM